MNAYLLDVLLRFGHIVFGVAWIGLLYYCLLYTSDAADE